MHDSHETSRGSQELHEMTLHSPNPVSPSHSKISDRANLPRLNPPTAPHVQTHRYHGEVSDTELTPATSSSGLSSQERGFPSKNDADLQPISHGFTTEWRMPQPLQRSPERTATKRTSSGQIKAMVSPSSQNPTNPSTRGSSVASTNGHLTELSDQLRTRLSYAMIKVQNGWEQHSLDEIESLASQRESPDSSQTGSTLGPSGVLQSPRAVMTATATAHRRRLSRARLSLDHRGGGRPTDLSSRSIPDLHQTTPILNGSSTSRPALAPPADIVPTTSLSRHARKRTASQNAAMEADAVETLLFLASPNNSGHQSHSQGFGTSQSPLKSNFGGGGVQESPYSHSQPQHQQAAKRVTFSGVGNGSGSGGREMRREERKEEIDRMIEEMSDSEDESMERLRPGL